MSDLLTVTTKNLPNGIVLLRLRGDIDASNSSVLAVSMQEHFTVGDYCLLLDFSEVRYMSSAGVATLIGSIDIARRNKGEVAVIGLAKNILDVFRMLGVLQKNLVLVCQSRAEAEAALATC